MKLVLISLMLFIIASLTLFSEAAWILLLFVIVGRFAITKQHLALRCGAIVAGVAILVLHTMGFKFYGSPILYDNRPVLNSPHQFSSFAAPNIILATDGTRFEVRGVTFTSKMIEMPDVNVQRIISLSLQPLYIQTDASSPSGVVFQRRCEYICGNSFYPSFIPRRLPRYAKTDLGRYLTSRDLATVNKPQ